MLFRSASEPADVLTGRRRRSGPQRVVLAVDRAQLEGVAALVPGARSAVCGDEDGARPDPRGTVRNWVLTGGEDHGVLATVPAEMLTQPLSVYIKDVHLLRERLLDGRRERQIFIELLLGNSLVELR